MSKGNDLFWQFDLCTLRTLIEFGIMKTIGKIALMLTGIGLCSVTGFGQELEVEGSATIQSAKNCSETSVGAECTSNTEESTIIWTHSSIQITRADGSVITLPLTRHVEEEDGESGNFHNHVYSCTDLVSGTAHSFAVTVYQGDLPLYDGTSYSHRVEFKDGNKEGAVTTYYGSVE